MHALPSTRRLRVAVLGLFSSGSSATSAILQRLGVALGLDVNAVYGEPRWLSAQLRTWWNEPDLEEVANRQQRVSVLGQWIENLEAKALGCTGAKHPLLTLCGPDLVQAWGSETKFIWTWRPLEDSIASLTRRRWWPGKERYVQERLWTAAGDFFRTRSHLVVSFDDVIHHPRREAQRIADFLVLPATGEQLDFAAQAVRQR